MVDHAFAMIGKKNMQPGWSDDIIQLNNYPCASVCFRDNGLSDE